VAPTLSAVARISGDRRDGSLEDGTRSNDCSQDLARTRAEVAAENLLVDGAKVNRVFEVARTVERSEARLLAIQSAFTGSPIKSSGAAARDRYPAGVFPSGAGQIPTT